MKRLKQLVEKIVLEEIKFVFEGKKHLDLNTFYELEGDVDEKYNWLKDNGVLLGKGSSRAVFLIDSSKVLKFAYVDPGWRRSLSSYAGIEQNKAEVRAYTNPKVQPIVPKIFDAADDYSWIISELVKPLEDNQKEWKKLTGVSFADFRKFIEPSKFFKSRLSDEKKSEIEKLPFVKKVLNLIEQEKTEPGDMVILEHWGKTADGRVVLLDYGYNEEVAPLYR